MVATALRIVDEEGAEALSMRTLAQRLKSGTATLYRHFSGRSELVAHVLDRLFGEAELDAEALSAMSWPRACRTVAQTMFDTLGRHRNAAALLVEEIPIGPNALALRECCLSILLDNGFPPHQAARAYATLARYVLGFAIQLTGPEGIDHGQERLPALFRGLDPAAFPATIAVAGSVPVPIEDEFSFGLDLIITGLAQLHDNPTDTRS
jgi:AcrR family transcriptional regulator